MTIAARANRLSNETSPYLLQHADNPVDWYPWGDEAFARARAEDKPIFLSIGYSTCHWCHVMAEESFEDEETARLVNALFVPIKVDREERPDVDDVYLKAVQLMTRQGGWPLNVFLTPDLHPYFGGTYFPLKGRGAMPSFREVLARCAEYFRDKREELTVRARGLVADLGAAGAAVGLATLEARSGGGALDLDALVNASASAREAALERLGLEADRVGGGFGGAPKFLQPGKVELFLWDDDASRVAHALHTLNRMRAGGVHDQIGGGFARYGVDAGWIVPHFEKMLYDNAQALPLFAHGAVALEAGDPALAEAFRAAARGLYSYLERDLHDADAGLYVAAEDADSEGEEGCFYVFTSSEFDDALRPGGGDALIDFARRFFGVSAKGNFEGANVLVAPLDPAEFARRRGYGVADAASLAERARSLLFEARCTRVRPSRDGKCLLGWNALAALGLMRSGVLLDEPEWVARGVEIVERCVSVYFVEDGWRHTYTAGVATIPAFADDIAFLLEACVEVLCLTGSGAALGHALDLAKTLHRQFVDPVVGTLYAARLTDDLIFRPTRPEDNVLPSAHSAALWACEALRTWAGLQALPPLDRGTLKMLEALSLVCLGNVVALAEGVPTACARSLTIARWMERRASVLIAPSDAATPDAAVPVAAFGVPWRSHAANRRGRVLVCVPYRPRRSLVDAARDVRAVAPLDVSYAACDVEGCRLPAATFA